MKIYKLIGYNLDTKSYINPDTELVDNLPYSPLIYSSESSIEGYEDISSIEMWDFVSFMDWSRRRDEIKPLFYAIASANLSTYSHLTAGQKLIGAKYFFVPYSLRVTNETVSEDQDKDNWEYLLTQTKKSRTACYEAMRIKTGQYIRTGLLTLLQTQQFFKDVYVYSTWFTQANTPDLKQWISNEAGSVYELDGFAQKSYYNIDLKNDLMDIYNGNY